MSPIGVLVGNGLSCPPTSQRFGFPIGTDRWEHALSDFPLPSREILGAGDDGQASSLFRYVCRMGGVHQIYMCLLALLVAAVSAAPLELQRRIVKFGRT